MSLPVSCSSANHSSVSFEVDGQETAAACALPSEGGQAVTPFNEHACLMKSLKMLTKPSSQSFHPASLYSLAIPCRGILIAVIVCKL
jgi:hypothetical protein